MIGFLQDVFVLACILFKNANLVQVVQLELLKKLPVKADCCS